MRDPLLIGVGHRAQQGKDSLATAIHALLPRESRIYHFSDDLKALARCLGLMQTKDAPVLQALGLLYRGANPNFWIERLMWRLQDDNPRVALIADLRYQNEATWIKANHGITIKVTRLTRDHLPYLAADRPADHPSETELEGWEWDRLVVIGENRFDETQDVAQRLVTTILGRLA